jgi:ABC-type multidrug transport system fused ATPase/permease subunit
MGYIWMLVPILPIVVGITLVISFIGVLISVISKVGSLQQPASALPAVGAIFAIYGFAIVSFYLILIIGSLALYYLIERRNRHFKRQQQLFSVLQRYLASKASASASGSIARLAQLSEDSIFEETDRPAGLWSILYLFVTPIVGVIAAYNLTQDLRKHDELQSAMQTALLSAFNEAGLRSPSFAPYRPHKRDPILFIILTAITAGLFWIYWFLTLLKDYNEHFQDQAHFEDEVLALLRPAPTMKYCSSCGESIIEKAKFCPRCGKQQPS